MATLRGNVEVDRPSATVSSYVADFERNPRWQGGVRACTFTSELPFRVGSVYEQDASLPGKTVRTTFEVTALGPGRSVPAVR